LDFGPTCNNRCAICPRQATGLAEEAALIAGVKEAVGEIALHGGEPTLHPGLERVIAAAGARALLETNGRAFAVAGRAEAARAAGLSRARVTLLGARAESHDWLSRAPGSFRQALAGAARLRAAGVALSVRLLVTRSSLPELGAMATLALGMGAEEVRFSWARMGPGGAREWLVPRYGLGAEGLNQAVEAVVRAGRTAELEGVPLCRAPARARAVASAGTCFAPEVAEEDVYGEACGGCARRDECPGVPRGYLARFGTGELNPF
jgi:MoaA/NifB/PqqE/SkfB family radical SAM enzyme